MSVITKQTQESKLDKQDVYICYTWNGYIEQTKFLRNTLQYIKEQNNLLEYWESTAEDLNSKETGNGMDR